MATTKTITKVIVAITFGVMVTVAMFGFKANSSAKQPLASAWYTYTTGLESNVTSYVKMVPQPNPDDEFCPGNITLCAIFAPEGPGLNPSSIPATLLDEITIAQDEREESENVRLKGN